MQWLGELTLYGIILLIIAFGIYYAMEYFFDKMPRNDHYAPAPDSNVDDNRITDAVYDPELHGE